jgi:hypothetical protein
VGDAVGAPVGEAVGAAVGDVGGPAVGACVHVPHDLGQACLTDKVHPKFKR